MIANIILFVLGILIASILIKLLLPKPKKIRVLPTLQNYKDITYIDDEGKYYKYELESFHL